MYTILGGGFGIYGYLPAVVRLYGRIILDRKYLSIVNSRPELTDYLSHIDWSDSRASALNALTNVIVAVNPAQQLAVADSILRMPHISRIVLEKPVAPSPLQSQQLLHAIYKASKNVRIGYIFFYTEWYDLIARIANSHNASLLISWKFMAYHFKNGIETWKRYHTRGGGVLRFYGIHLIAILADLGFDDLISSSLKYLQHDQPTEWCLTVQNNRGVIIQVYLSCMSNDHSFSIQYNNTNGTLNPLYSSSCPLMTVKNDSIDDPRVSALERLLTSFSTANKDCSLFYHSVNSLWARIEDLCSIN